jgi:hypothetical protein
MNIIIKNKWVLAAILGAITGILIEAFKKPVLDKIEKELKT